MQTLTPQFTLPSRTITGRGKIDTLLETAAGFGSDGLVVYIDSVERSGVLERLRQNQPDGLNVRYWQYGHSEPTLALLEDLKVFAEEDRVDWVAAIGGGSAIDIAQACCGLLGSQEPLLAYQTGKKQYASNIPFIAVPTTAGTGAEATPAAVVLDEATHLKKAIINPAHQARVVILDADLLATCPPSIVAASGMDAFTQAVEAYISNVDSSVFNGIACEAIGLIHKSLPACVQDPAGSEMENLLFGSFLAGVALANIRLGLVHGLAHPLGARSHAPHGLVCAVLLAPVLRFNKPSIEKQYEVIANIIGCDPIEQVEQWNMAFGLKSPFKQEHFSDMENILEYTLNAGVTLANPRPVSAEDVTELLNNLPLVD